jgi:CubicO group peptidase (beta-lactamase class C family)
LIGELVHRLTSLSLRDVVHQHITQPLGADFQIGLRRRRRRTGRQRPASLSGGP